MRLRGLFTFSVVALSTSLFSCTAPCDALPGGCRDGGVDLAPLHHIRIYRAVAATRTYDVITAHGSGFRSVAGYDFGVGGGFIEGTLTYRAVIQRPSALENRVVAVTVKGPADTTTPVREPCLALTGKAGDFVRSADGKNSICVTPNFAMAVYDSVATLLYERPVSYPVPPPSYGLSLPVGQYLPLGAGCPAIDVVTKIHGSVDFDVADLDVEVQETAAAGD